jgi:hypothetical protein
MDERIERMSKFRKMLPNLLLILVCVVDLTSCIGIDASAKIDAKGAGTLSIEYQISKDFVQLGPLESTPPLPLPLSREDIERGLQGTRGVTLKSYSKSERGDNIIVSMVLAFDSPSDMTAYLDPNGKLAQYQEENGRSHLRLSFGDTVQPLDPQVQSEISEKLKLYRFKFALEAPRAAPEISIKNGDFFHVTSSGKKTVVECPMADIITCNQMPEIDITWQQ